jgi:energy-coupling factor transporter ATP-binding protein EcfA2
MLTRGVVTVPTIKNDIAFNLVNRKLKEQVIQKLGLEVIADFETLSRRYAIRYGI